MSYTTTYSWTRTNAKYIASKVSADLAFMQRIYGKPTTEWIEKYDTELTEMLAAGYLDVITYGFRRDGNWVAALRYQVTMNGTLSDEGAGRLLSIIGKDIVGAEFHSFMSYNQAWWDAGEVERGQVRGRIGFSRTSGSEPGVENGYWETDRSYASGTGGVSRSVLKSY